MKRPWWRSWWEAPRHPTRVSTATPCGESKWEHSKPRRRRETQRHPASSSSLCSLLSANSMDEAFSYFFSLFFLVSLSLFLFFSFFSLMLAHFVAFSVESVEAKTPKGQKADLPELLESDEEVGGSSSLLLFSHCVPSGTQCTQSTLWRHRPRRETWHFTTNPSELPPLLQRVHPPTQQVMLSLSKTECFEQILTSLFLVLIFRFCSVLMHNPFTQWHSHPVTELLAEKEAAEEEEIRR